MSLQGFQSDENYKLFPFEIDRQISTIFSLNVISIRLKLLIAYLIHDNILQTFTKETR